MKTRPDIRNVAIVAHVDHGKTTLVDAMLKQSGVFREGQQVATRVLDSNPLERERGITILSKNTAVRHGDVKFNIVDTPGHADFGGEVERVLQMVQGVLLLVDAAEGVMPQTRFVLRKALELDLRAIVVVNKIDRRDARPQEVVNETFDLFVELGANDEQADFPVLFTNAKAGIAKRSLDDAGDSLEPLFETIVARVPEPPAEEGPFQLLISAIDHNRYVGRVGIGRIFRGSSRRNEPIVKLARDGAVTAGLRLATLLTFAGLERIDVEEASAGDIVCISGIEDLNIGDTIADAGAPEPIAATAVDEPTVSMFFSVNTSPFAGREGKFLTSRQIRERLERELESNVALRVADTASPDTFEVRGRGELHLAILIETMRREGYELGVSKPQVIVTERDGKRYEPVEYVVVDVPEEYAGAAIEALGRRKATMSNMLTVGDLQRLEYTMPTRAIFGLRGELLTLTRGTAVLSHTYYDHQPWQGELPGRNVGALVASDTGRSTGYALMGLEQRGRFFVGPGIDVYEGMIVGRANDEYDVAINVVREKKLTNMRAAGSDENVKLAPPEEFSLERALEFIGDDELVEVTPKSIRLRKRILDETERLRLRKREAAKL
ncbi:MAG: translational GTPase TypA [Candidatus Eremiobacteraeota bacterium]|nr:translational GTPase TypA [Candidatus Eremiobacteraeota bacterium]MBV8499023.1 translational GTPase TypA [Candidatus Eremiobacteraeota bacterium]